MSKLVPYVLIALAVLFALVAPASSAPGKPLYPTSDSQSGVFFSLLAVFIAFCAGASW